MPSTSSANRVFLALLFLALPCGAQKARRHPLTAVRFEAQKDNTLYQDPLGGLSNGAGAHLFAGLTATGAIHRAAVAFDVAANVPAGAQILSVKLTLHVTRTFSGPQDMSLHRLSSDWGEGTSDALGEEGGGAAATPGDATWLHTFHPGCFWLTAGGDFAATASATRTVGFTGPHVWSSAGMVADVQGWLDTPATNHGWMLVGAEPMGGFLTAKRFGSREGIPVLRPMLTVIYQL